MKKTWRNLGRYTKRTLSVTQNAYYLKISDCPLEAWEKRFTEGDAAIRIHNKTNIRGKLINSLNGKRLRWRKYNTENDYEAWCILFDDFRDKIGLDPDFEDYILDKCALQEAQIEFILSKVSRGGVEVRNRKHLNMINKLKARIKKFESLHSGKKATITSILVSLYRGEKLQLLNKKNLTAEEYFTLIDSFNKKAA